MNLKHIKSLMKDDPIIIDGRTTLDPEEVLHQGFTFRAVGRGQYR